MACVARERGYTKDKCQHEREDYMECLHYKKLAERIDAIEEQKEKLVSEGKWPPPSPK